MSVYHHIRQLVVQKNFFNKVWFFWKTTNIDFLLFSVLPRHIKIKSPFKYKSICGRVVKPSGLNIALLSCDRIITGSSLRRCSIHPSFVFSIILNEKYCLPAFHCWLLYFIISYILFSLIWGLLENYFIYKLFLHDFQYKKLSKDIGRISK